MTKLRSASCAAILTAILGWPSFAHAQSGFAIDRFRPTPAGDAFFGVSGATTDGIITPRAAIGFDYAHDPLRLVVRCPTSATGCMAPVDNEASVVASQLSMHVAGSLTFLDRAMVSVDVPAALVNSGDGSDLAGGAPAGAAMSDVRVGARVRLVGDNHGPAVLAVGGYVWFPSGAEDQFAGNGTVRGMPHLAGSGKVPIGDDVAFVWTSDVGVLVRDAAATSGNVALGSEITFGAAVGVLLIEETLQLGPEVFGAIAVAGDEPASDSNTNLELLMGARYRFLDDFRAGVGAGPGVTSGVGTPAFRGVFQLGYVPTSARDDSDSDADGVQDAIDACPDRPGVANTDSEKHGCPPDQDGDRIVDEEDACPTVSGVRNGDPKLNGCPGDVDADGIFDDQDACPSETGVRHFDPKRNGCPADSDSDTIRDLDDACPSITGKPNDDPKLHGCPLDRDRDSVLDDKDACPDRPGVRSDDPKKDGCPVDTDGDNIANDRDACPLEKGSATDDPKTNGCPTLVRVTDSKIEVLQQPRFASDEATILAESQDLLTQVAQVLKEHPEITLVRVEGHTDNRGPAAYNLRLSEHRARAVREALVRLGIRGDRLEAKGYGLEKPIASNDTEQGRAENRRVKFEIIKRDDSKARAAPGANAPPTE